MSPSPNKLRSLNTPTGGKGLSFHLPVPTYPEADPNFVGPDPLGQLDGEPLDDYKLFRAWVTLHPKIRVFASMAAEEMAKVTKIDVTDKMIFALARTHDWVKRLDTFEAMMFEVAALEQRRAISAALGEHLCTDLLSIRTARAILEHFLAHPDKSNVEAAARLQQETFERLGVRFGVRDPNAPSSSSANDARDLAAKLDRLLAGGNVDSLAVLDAVAEDAPPDSDPSA